jgi:hypothetical protein
VPDPLLAGLDDHPSLAAEGTRRGSAAEERLRSGCGPAAPAAADAI